MVRGASQRAVRNRSRLVALTLLVAVSLGYWGYIRSLDTEARDLFAPDFGTSDDPFDIDKTLFDGKPVSALIAAARNGTERERKAAILGLHHVHHGCSVDCKHSMYGGTTPEIRRRMLFLAERGRIGRRAPFLLPVLIEALKDPSAQVRAAAAFALMSMNAEALSACEALGECLGDPDTTVRLWAARALYFIRFDTEASIATSVAVLRDGKEVRDREMAAYNLDLMGADAKTAIPALQVALDDSSEEVRTQVRQAIRSIQR